MPELLLRDVDERLLHDLQQCANEKGCTAEDEAKKILYQVVKRRHDINDFLKEANEFARRVGPQTIDSAEIIREEREKLMKNTILISKL